MRKIFFLAGELSGDMLAAWYVQTAGLDDRGAYTLEGVGGDHLEDIGCKIYLRYERLNVTGVGAVVRHAFALYSLFNMIFRHICRGGFDELVLVDFPGFNVRMARAIKRRAPHVKITYVSPPQVWCWGQWRLKSIQKNCDDVVVIYPFEVAWYAARGLRVRWLGLPLAQRVRKDIVQPKDLIGLFPASRPHELRTLLPIFLEAVRSFVRMHPTAKFALFLTKNFDAQSIEDELYLDAELRSMITIVRPTEDKMAYMNRCLFALTKPGTITLELALLQIPAVVVYKIGWLTYFIGRLLAQVKFMGLPNLLAGQQIMPELLQAQAKPAHIADELNRLWIGCQNGDVSGAYLDQQRKLASLVTSLHVAQ